MMNSTERSVERIVEYSFHFVNVSEPIEELQSYQ
jgi:hypothetical protein